MRRLRRFLRLLYIALSKPVIRAWRDSAERPIKQPSSNAVPLMASMGRGLLEVTGEPPTKLGKKRHRNIGVFGDRG